jgi:hypothetical protein
MKVVVYFHTNWLPYFMVATIGFMGEKLLGAISKLSNAIVF